MPSTGVHYYQMSLYHSIYIYIYPPTHPEVDFTLRPSVINIDYITSSMMMMMMIVQVHVLVVVVIVVSPTA